MKSFKQQFYDVFLSRPTRIAGLSKGKRGNWNLVSTVALDHVCVHAWRRHVRQCTCACICQKNVYVKLKEKNGDGRLDSACAVVTNTGLKLSLPWLDAGEQGCSGIIPVRPGPVTPFDLSKFQEVRPAWSSLELPKSISHCVTRTVAGSDVLKKGLFGSFPNQVACISKPTRSISVLHKWNAAGDREIERRRDFFTSSKTDLLSDWTFENYPKLSSVGHFQSEQAFTPPTHFRTLFGFSEKFGNCRPPLTKSLGKN